MHHTFLHHTLHLYPQNRYSYFKLWKGRYVCHVIIQAVGRHSPPFNVLRTSTVIGVERLRELWIECRSHITAVGAHAWTALIACSGVWAEGREGGVRDGCGGGVGDGGEGGAREGRKGGVRDGGEEGVRDHVEWGITVREDWEMVQKTECRMTEMEEWGITERDGGDGGVRDDGDGGVRDHREGWWRWRSEGWWRWRSEGWWRGRSEGSRRVRDHGEGGLRDGAKDRVQDDGDGGVRDHREGWWRWRSEDGGGRWVRDGDERGAAIRSPTSPSVAALHRGSPPRRSQTPARRRGWRGPPGRCAPGCSPWRPSTSAAHNTVSLLLKCCLVLWHTTQSSSYNAASYIFLGKQFADKPTPMVGDGQLQNLVIGSIKNVNVI